MSCGTAYKCSDLWGKLPAGSGTRVPGRGNFSNARLRFLIGLAAKAVIFRREPDLGLARYCWPAAAF